MREERIIAQVSKMLEAGRITPEEAERLRATEGTDEFERVVAAIRVRHAGEHMAAAVVQGEMTEEESDAYLERLRSGEHPDGLRARLRKHRAPRRH
jgi:demethoxyubiquinone hydroxylase (CLK1/Coq7/Cat5 family)